MSKQEKLLDVSCDDVNDLIFKFNCAKHFCGPPPRKQNGKYAEATLLCDANDKESSQCQVMKSSKEDSPQKSILMKRTDGGREIDQRKEMGTVFGRKEEHRTTEKRQDHKPPQSQVIQEVIFSNLPPTEIVLAVDATPTRVGGLLRLPGRERTIFYYSINWANRLKIDDSTKFEMINTALALELFDPYLKAYRPRYQNFIVKTDSHFYESIKGFKDPYDFEFLIGVRDKVKSFQGVFQHAVISQKDADIQNADYLSRNELPLGLKIKYNNTSGSQSTKNDCPDYALVDLSTVANNFTLDVISEAVPGKYIKGYNYV